MNIVKSEKYRKLSISALVTGILAVSLTIIFQLLDDTMVKFIPSLLGNAGVLLFSIFIIVWSVILGLSITAVVCGSIDLIRIKVGRYSNKGRGFDIAGIVLGVIFSLPVIFFLSDTFGT